MGALVPDCTSHVDLLVPAVIPTAPSREPFTV
jgi:hypothetical protein